MRIHLYIILICLFISECAFSQADTWKYGAGIDDAEMEQAIVYYDQFNPLMGGKSYRDCGGRKCNGNVIDKYPDGTIKHKGFYTGGQLLNGYENYFENGQIERRVRVIGGSKLSVVTYYSDGTMRSEIIYLKNKVLLWKDYYPNGNLEYWEEYDNNQTYYVTLNFYYINGNPQNTMQLVDKKNKLYDAKEYYLDGTLKAEGKKKWIPASGGYVKIGQWKYYDAQGNLVKTEEHQGESEDDLDFLNE